VVIHLNDLALHPGGSSILPMPDQAASRNLKVGLATKKGNGGDASQHPEAGDTGNQREHTPLRVLSADPALVWG
jgi:hypothetical protein